MSVDKVHHILDAPAHLISYQLGLAKDGLDTEGSGDTHQDAFHFIGIQHIFHKVFFLDLCTAFQIWI